MNSIRCTLPTRASNLILGDMRERKPFLIPFLTVLLEHYILLQDKLLDYFRSIHELSDIALSIGKYLPVERTIKTVIGPFLLGNFNRTFNSIKSDHFHNIINKFKIPLGPNIIPLELTFLISPITSDLSSLGF